MCRVSGGFEAVDMRAKADIFVPRLEPIEEFNALISARMNVTLDPGIKLPMADGLLINRLPMAAGPYKFSSYEKVKEVEEFFARCVKPSIAMTLKQSIEWVQINAKWVETCRNKNKRGLMEEKPPFLLVVLLPALEHS
nr:peptidase M1, alanine aminopeptidase/leukotriene A4 hydrolase [Tanacetum cinerariifolium]